MDMSRTYGFVTGQSSALDVIKNKYPQLKTQVYLTQNEFDLKFSKSVDEIKRILSNKLGSSEWENYKANLLKISNEQNNTNLTSESVALNFLDEVKSRVRGNIESPVIETLLMFNSNYQKYPIGEFADGFKKRLYSKNSNKSKDVDFQIDVPKSWKVKEGKRPNALWLVSDNNGYLDEGDSSVSLVVLVKELPEKIDSITSQDAKDFCSEAFNGNPVKECIKTRLENLPTIYARATMTYERLRFINTVEVANYIVFYENRIIFLQGMVGTINNKLSKNQLNEKFDKYLPLFDQIANSLVIKDIYRKY